MAILTKLCLLAVFVTVAVLTLRRWIKHHRINDFKKLPQMQPDELWGHLKIMNEFLELKRPGESSDMAFTRMAQETNSPSCFLVDLRPFNRPILVISSHELAEQVSRPSRLHKYSVNKSPDINQFADMTGHTSIVLANGEPWKQLRKRFNPGFAPSHLVTLLPAITQMTRRFLANLDLLAATGEEFTLDSLITPLTFDIIGAVVLDVNCNAQGDFESSHKLFRQFIDLAAVYDSVTRYGGFDPLRDRKKRKLGDLVAATCKEIIIEKFKDSRNLLSSSGRSVLALSLQNIDRLTPQILTETADQLKSFAFAGHDTTSITLQWAFYELARHPRAASQLKAELDDVFGPESDADSVLTQLCVRGEEAISKLQFTSAVVKELLRLYPPAGTARLAAKNSNFTLRIPELDEEVVLDDIVLYLNHRLIGRDPKVYGENANMFCPERWLGNTDTSMEADGSKATHDTLKDSSTMTDGKIPAAAWRPFERGPRNCIGQELANLEVRVILACAARRYNFEKVGIGAFAKGPDSKPVLNQKTGAYEVVEEMYSRRQITARPVDDMRMKVSLLENAGVARGKELFA